MSITTQAFKPTGRFNTFRLTEHQAERTHAKIDRCCSFYYITCGSVYNVAQSAMVDAAAELRERPDIFRHRLKYNVRRALAAYDVWNGKMERQLADRYQLWLDISDKVDEEMQPHITKLYWAIKAVLMKRNIPDYALRARCETALIVCHLARTYTDAVFAHMRETVGVDVGAFFFTGADFSDVSHFWEEAFSGYLATADGQEKIDFNDDSNCRLALDILERVLSEQKIFNHAGAYALHRNPDQWKHLDKVDRMRLKKGLPLVDEEGNALNPCI